MPSFSLRRYDTQARFGVILSLLATICLLALAGMVFSADKGFSNFSFSDFTIVYGPTRQKVILAVGFITMLLAVSGFGFGLNSVGQRRNDKPALSWISFLVGGTVLCLALVLLFFFHRQGQPMIR